jgi:hypothetical protein
MNINIKEVGPETEFKVITSLLNELESGEQSDIKLPLMVGQPPKQAVRSEEGQFDTGSRPST